MNINEVKLADLCEVITKGTTPSNIGAEFTNEGIKYIRSEMLTSSKYISEDGFLYISEDTHHRLKRSQLKSGDILFSMAGVYLGKTAILRDCDVPSNTNQAVALIRVIPERCNREYVYHYLNLPEVVKSVNSITGQAAQPNINLKQIGNIPIKLPSKEKQDAIVSSISAYDDLIENNQKQIKLLEEAAQRLYKEWFVDLRFPGHETTPITDGIPKGWGLACLDDVISKITTGLNPRKNFTLGVGKNYYVTIKNMANNSIYLNDKCDKVDDEAIEKINKRSDLQVGDILFSGIGTIGRVYMIDIPTNNWNVSESVFTMRANDMISKEYLYLLLLSHDMQSYCDQNAHGVAQRGIRMADLRAYKFYLPNKSLLDSFTVIVKPLIEKTQHLRQQITLLEETRDRLLPKLMNGEIEV